MKKHLPEAFFHREPLRMLLGNPGGHHFQVAFEILKGSHNRLRLLTARQFKFNRNIRYWWFRF